jgi:hypothetical protein
MLLSEKNHLLARRNQMFFMKLILSSKYFVERKKSLNCNKKFNILE